MHYSFMTFEHKTQGKPDHISSSRPQNQVAKVVLQLLILISPHQPGQISATHHAQ
jgi:hypothetical protein